jgi:hypothetical protein
MAKSVSLLMGKTSTKRNPSALRIKTSARVMNARNT